MTKYIIKATGQVGSTALSANVFVKVDLDGNVTLTSSDAEAYEFTDMPAAICIKNYLNNQNNLYGVTFDVDSITVGG